MAFYVLAFGGTLFTLLGGGITYLEVTHHPADPGLNVRTITVDPTRSAVPESLPSPPAPSLSASPVPSVAMPASPSAAKDKITALEDKVTELVNVERAATCGPLRTDERLRKAARAHSADMAANNYFSHVGLNGSSFVDRLVRAGYPRNSSAAENIAMGYSTAKAVVAGWMGSKGHKANILNCSYKAVGLGVAYRGSTPYWTQDFGRS